LLSASLASGSACLACGESGAEALACSREVLQAVDPRPYARTLSTPN